KSCPRTLSSGRGECLDQLAELVWCRNRSEDRQRHASLDEGVDPRPHLLRAAEDEHLLDQLPGGGGGRSLPVTRLPGCDHRVDLVAEAEPAVESGVDRNRDVGGEHETGQRLHRLALARQAEEATE